MAIKGIIPVNKPTEWTSFDVVNRLKYKLKPNKVGHLGTLDPMATGVLLITVGKATKLFDFMQKKHKTYLATFEFGHETDTLDATGKVVKICANIPTKEEILRVLPKFMGKISQIPPKYSAKSINGVRAYDLARQNVDFELKAKEIEIFDIKLIDYQNAILTLEIECGSGTYIRSIGRDIAKEVNSLATMINLVRTQVGTFPLNLCHDVKNVDKIEELIVPIKQVLNCNKLELSNIEQQKILNGRTIEIPINDGIYSLEDEKDTIALVEVRNKNAKMSVFLE